MVKRISDSSKKKIISYIKADSPDINGGFISDLIGFINLYYNEVKRDKNLIKIDPQQVNMFEVKHEPAPLDI